MTTDVLKLNMSKKKKKERLRPKAFSMNEKRLVIFQLAVLKKVRRTLYVGWLRLNTQKNMLFFLHRPLKRVSHTRVLFPGKYGDSFVKWLDISYQSSHKISYYITAYKAKYVL